jgi:hypothetical protein
VRKRLRAAPFVAALVFVVAVLTGLGPAHAQPASAATGDHRAAVVVSANGTVVRKVVTFRSDSIGGLEALRSAGFDPVVYGFSGLGAAICALHVPPQGPVIGCPADNTCLTCASPIYWSYHEAPSGTSTFHISRAGASNTRVRDGDVEGWKWGSGDPPPYTSVASLTGPPPGPPPTAAPPAPGAGGGGSGSVPRGTAPKTPNRAGAVVTTTTPTTAAPPAGVAAPTTASTAASGTVPPSTTTARGARVEARRASRDRGSGSGPGSAVGFAVFALVAAALGAGVVLARRARGRAT